MCLSANGLHDGAWPTDFPIEQRLGGEAGFRQMVRTGAELGFHSTVHLNTVMACFQSPDFHSDWGVHDVWGQPKLTGVWGGGAHGSHWGMAIPEAALRARFERIQRLGLNGMLYLDGMGNPLYPNHHPVHRGPRSQYASGIRRFLDLAREYFGPGVMGTVLGAMTMTSSFGMALGPLGGGWLFDTFGTYHWLYIASAAIGLGGAALALAFPAAN